MSSFMRQVHDALSPQGPAWEPAPSGKFDRLLDGFADNAQAVLDDLESLAYIRNPNKVPRELLPDLEREYGIDPDDTIPNDDRREGLGTVVYRPRASSLVRELQSALDKAGYGVNGYGLTVTPNGTPAINPQLIINENFVLTAHEYPSLYAAGTPIAYAGERGGYYLVNGDHFNSRPIYPGAGTGMTALPFPSASCAGYYEGYQGYENEYTADIPQAYWPFAFFVGGTVTRNEDGSVASIATVTVPIGRRQELHRLILRVKPLHSWCGCLIVYA
jgi:hypothetical protein